MREEIDELYDNFELESCVNKCKSVLSTLNFKDEYDYDMIFYCYYKMSSSYSSLNNFKLSLHNANEAKKFITNDTNMAKLNWAYSYCYYNYNNDLSLQYIQEAIEIFERISPSASYLFEARVHKAVLTNDETLLLESIKQAKLSGRDRSRIDELYVDLYFLYMNKKNVLKAQLAIMKIGSNKTKNILKKHVETYAINYKKQNNGGRACEESN